jgi:hypothetical protein
LRSPGIDSQPGGPVRQPYSSYWPAELHRLAESISRNRFLGSINDYKYELHSFLQEAPQGELIWIRTWVTRLPNRIPHFYLKLPPSLTGRYRTDSIFHIPSSYRSLLTSFTIYTKNQLNQTVPAHFSVSPVCATCEPAIFLPLG